MKNIERLKHVARACEWIEELVSRGQAAFDGDELIQDSIVRKIEIIGEACSHIDSEFREEHNQIPWREATRMRNILIHAYFGIDLTVVWQTASVDIPQLGRQIRVLLDSLGIDERLS